LSPIRLSPHFWAKSFLTASIALSGDPLFEQALEIVLQQGKASASYIQRKLGIGYNKAARLVEQMEEEGVVTPANHVGKREILVPGESAR
jgi:S-DNA-T family DNA segregation ATPase FtsK/SpoIIIE